MDNCLLIFSDIHTPRLRFVLDWMFGERLGIRWEITDDPERYRSYEGGRLSYTDRELAGEDNIIRIRPAGLLAEKGIREQALGIHRWRHSTVLFYNQPGAVIPFDIFSAVFYLISRYEEYLPHKKDRHGRYSWQQSAAGRYSFIQQPVIDEWLVQLSAICRKNYGIRTAESRFAFQPTYDIDMAWRFLHKGLFRTAGACIKDAVKADIPELLRRFSVLAGKTPDPFFCFKELDELHFRYRLTPVFFWLLGRHSRFDRNTDPGHPAMKQLVRNLSSVYDCGIHPSYGAQNRPGRLEEEIGILEQITGKKVTKSRQHFIRFALPDTYRRLATAGITDEFSMGYAGINGFRAGTSHSFLWYDLAAEQASALRVHPFSFMDATAKFYNRSSPEDAYREWERLYYAIYRTGGTFRAIWHNYILSNYREYEGWLPLYERCLQLVSPSEAQ